MPPLRSNNVRSLESKVQSLHWTPMAITWRPTIQKVHDLGLTNKKTDMYEISAEMLNPIFFRLFWENQLSTIQNIEATIQSCMQTSHNSLHGLGSLNLSCSRKLQTLLNPTKTSLNLSDLQKLLSNAKIMMMREMNSRGWWWFKCIRIR